MTEIFKNLPDDSINALIRNGISQKVSGLEKIPELQRNLFANTETGIPQGNPLSPLFSNIFLRPFDLRMKKENLALIRYADDFIIMCKSKEEAEKAYAVSKQVLENQLGLKLHELSSDSKSKTKIVLPTKSDFSFLSVGFDGRVTYPSEKNVAQFISNIDKLCNVPSESKNVLTVLRRVNNSLDGWISTFSFTDDIKRYFNMIDTSINRQVLNSLNHFGWKLTSSSLGKVKYQLRNRDDKGRLDSGQCLSKEQRQNSGILNAKEILKLRKKKVEAKKTTLKTSSVIQKKTS